MEGQGAGGAQQVGDLGGLDECHAAEGRGGRHDDPLDGPLGGEPGVERPGEQGIVVVGRRGERGHLLQGRCHGL